MKLYFGGRVSTSEGREAAVTARARYGVFGLGVWRVIV